MGIDMVVADVDGTLINSAGAVSPAVKATVADVIAAGVRFSLATGRRRKVALPVARELGLTDPLVVFDGAAIVDPVTGQCLDRQLLSSDMATEALRMLKAQESLAVFLQEDPMSGDGVLTCSERERHHLAGIYPGIAPDVKVVVGLPERGLCAVRLLAFGEMTTLAEAVRRLRDWQGRLMLWPSLPTAVLECYAPGVNKGSGLLRLCGLLGVDPSATVGIGDDLNDIPLLATAGVPVAMGNAHPELRRRASLVCDDVDRTGIEDVLAAVAAGRSLL